MTTERTDLLRGTLDMLILKTLTLQPLHGLGVARRIEQVSDGVLQVPAGSLFPALHRLEQKGWIRGTWGESENNRRAKYYRLTAAGRRRVGEERETWARQVLAITKVMEAT